MWSLDNRTSLCLFSNNTRQQTINNITNLDKFKKATYLTDRNSKTRSKGNNSKKNNCNLSKFNIWPVEKKNIKLFFTENPVTFEIKFDWVFLGYSSTKWLFFFVIIRDPRWPSSPFFPQNTRIDWTQTVHK